MAKPRRNRASRRIAERIRRNAERRGAIVQHESDGAEIRRLAPPPELERVRDRLSPREYVAARALRVMWNAGTLNGEDDCSHIAKFGMGRNCRTIPEVSDERLDAQDQLRAACRSMGMLGKAGRYAVEVVVYDRRVHTLEELSWLRDALGRFAGGS